MGAFSSKRKVFVASTVYNLAGDEAGRQNYVKSSIAAGVIGSNSKTYLGERLVNDHLNGPGIKQRSVFRWAKNNYPLGVPSASIINNANVDPAIVANQIPHAANENVIVQEAFIEAGDFIYLAEQHILANKPELYNTDWVADVDYDLGVVLIQYEDASTGTIALGDFDYQSDYVGAYYHIVINDYDSPLSEGTLSGIGYTAPDVSTYALDNTIITPESVDLDEVTQVTKTYSDSTPDENSSSTATSTVNYDNKVESYSKTTYQGLNVDENRLEYLNEYKTVHTGYEIQQTVDTTTVTNDEGGGVTSTTTTTVTTDVVVPTYREKDDTQYTFSLESNSGLQLFLYRVGSGNTALDNLRTDDEAFSEFYPFIPFRINNVFVNEEEYDNEYPLLKKAYKKATNAKIEEMIESLETSESIGDIDYAFMVYGVPLNTEDNSSRKYVYNLFKKLIPFQTTTGLQYKDYLDDAERRAIYDADYAEWLAAQINNSSESGNVNTNDPLYGTPPPTYVNPGSITASTLKIASDDPVVSSYDQRILWTTIFEENFNGQYEPDMKTGDVKIIIEDDDRVVVSVSTNINPETGNISQTENIQSIPKFKMIYQTSDNTYTVMNVLGMTHRNYVYGGHYVNITPAQAMDDDEESGFIIPIHHPTVLEMSLVDSTQMSLSNTLLLLNSYQIVKVKFYQRGAFKILVYIVLIVLAVLGAPQLAAAGVGVLGTNAAVGAALGYAGTAALIAGAVANAIAAIIIAEIISRGAVALFGEKIGSIIAAIVNFVVLGGFASFNPTVGLQINWGAMMRIDNLLNLTSVGIGAYANWLNADTLAIQTEFDKVTKEYEAETEKIEELTKELGFGGAYIDPLMLTDLSLNDELYYESSETFINRTTMTGTDLIEMSFSMVYDYPEITLTLPKA